MAWSNPTSRSNGYVVPDTEWNKNTVDNPTALRAGEIAISGQAAEALIKASSASQLATVTVPARGAVLYAGASGAPAWLAAGTDGYVLKANGAGADPAWESLTAIESQNRDVAEVEVGPSSVAETTVYSYTVPGGTLSTNRMLRLTAIGDILNNSGGAQSLTVLVKYGATTILTMATGSNLSASANRSSMLIQAWISAKAATNAQVAGGNLRINNVGGSGTAADMSVDRNAVNNSIAEDSTADKALVVTVQLGASNGSFSAKVYTVQLELI